MERLFRTGEASPQASGLRERGQEVTRLEAFVDAAFAFALTMLVISVGSIPDSAEDLIAALKGIPAFAASFALIAMFWNAHARWSRRYGLDDGPTTRLSLVLVFLVMVYVYPLRMLFGSLFSWISGQWLPAGFEIHHWSDLQLMFSFYAIAYGTLGLVIAALFQHAWRLRGQLALSAEERVELLVHRNGWLVSPVVALLSLLLALFLHPDPSGWEPGLPGMAYVLLWVRQPLAHWTRRRALLAAPV
ncbi:MAG TPA: TMEM175 family protein [Luteimonas sp.]|jgi:uncharacterized membrane protein|nr:TMEM175 family protein [Luteimonas sp.]